MRHLLCLLATAALFSAPASAFAYTQTLSATTTIKGQDHMFNFTGLPAGTGTVTLTVALQGDFSYGNLSNPEGSENYADGNFLGTFIPANDTPPTGDCTGEVYTKDFTFPVSYINDNNAVLIRVDLFTEVDTFCGGQQDIAATITYSDNTPPVLSAIADQTIPEDTPSSAGFMINDAEDANGDVTVSATSSNPAVIATVTAVNNNGSGMLSWTPVGDATGDTTITLTATDTGGASAVETFQVTVTPVNDAPVADTGGPYAGNEGAAIGLDASGSTDIDDAIVSYEWDCDNDATYELVVAGPTDGACTFDDDGTYTIGLRVQDASGAFSPGATGTVIVANVAPSLTLSGPSAGDEGQVLVYSAPATDPSSSDAANLVYVWDVTDSSGASVASGASSTLSFTPQDDGVYTVGVVVSDPAGDTDSGSMTVTVANVAPTLSVSGPSTGDEGAAGTWTLVGADASPVDAAALTYTWDITDSGAATVASGTGAAVAWTPADDGVYTLSGTTTDPQSATGSGSLTITVANAAPSVVSITAPSTGDEGSLLAFSSTVDDPGSADVAGLVTTWDWGDGSAVDTGSSPDHAYADDGVYTITVTVVDGDGGSDSDTATITIANLAPTIDSTPGTSAPEGALYSYAPTVTDPGDEVFAWSLSGSAPSGMSIDAGSGLIEWTPSYADALVGSFPIVLTVDDGDGATDAQSWTVLVTVADDDNDGLADGWETANGLDPTDPNDAAGDPDLDGMTNLDEYTNGTDPNIYDGPSAPTLVSPIAGEEAFDVSPDLVFDNATDPQNEALTYAVEVYEDAALTTFVTGVTGVTESSSGQTEWKVDVTLTENAEYWWRAQASDAWVAGPWSTAESFVVNEINEAPDTPVLTFPIGGETAASASPVLTWSEAADIDGDEVTYDVEVYDAAGALVTSTTGVVGDGLAGSWATDVALDEDAFYAWTARAVDDNGLAGDWADAEDFFVSSENAAPTDTVFLRPDDGAALVELSPVLEASVSVDPEGGAVEYRFELDTTASFDGADLLTVTVDEPLWDLADDGVVLAEESTVYARVRAIDEAGVSSVPDTISFFIRGENDAPGVPVLVAPADGEEGGASPALVVEDPLDPEGDVVLLDFVVARDAELTDVITGVQGLVVSGAGTTEWTVDATLQGTVFWSARAVDLDGAASEWAAPWSYEAPSEPVPPAGDDDDDDDGAGCDCESTVAGGAPSGLAVFALLLPLLFVRRRR